MYFMSGLGLTNNILWNVNGIVFHHLSQGGEEKNSQVKIIKSNKEIRLINSDQRLKPINPNQRIELIKPNQRI